MSDWHPIKGDGSDRLPLGTWYDALRRDGRIEEACCVTKFCASLGPELFRDFGQPWDAVAVRVHGRQP